ncbi:DEAD/DEAH box helicase [Pontibacter arcticus]|uniref:DEAD/DEAH box helicase n=1 Tax=Pontibacter arcticus TaxID=2080288 RepID=UPI001402A749|nr:DEAD/DEAH box helicase [Pontibacter arcticus]
MTHDLEAFAAKLKLINKEIPQLEEKLAVQLLNLAERLSRRAIGDQERNICLTICGLVWEHKNKAWDNLPSFLMQVLSRLGLIPSARMVDLNYNIENQEFSNLGSLIAQFAFESKLLECETQVIDDYFITLSTFQKRMWDLIDQKNRIGISAPTSAGKSYVLANKIVHHLHLHGGSCIYVVPTITLINQVSSDLRRLINELELNINVGQTYSEKHISKQSSNILVLTQERALSAISQGEDFFKNLELLIIDEIQNIERVANEDNDRSRDLYNLIREFEDNLTPKKIVVAGPRIKNIDEVVTELFGKEAQSINNDLPPVLNLSYSFIYQSGKVLFRQYSTISKKPKSIIVDNFPVNPLKFFNSVRYNDSSFTLLNSILNNLDPNEGNIVFAPTKASANSIAKNINGEAKLTKELNSLIEYVSNSISPNYSLVSCLKGSTCYHHANVPGFLRTVIEKAFSKNIIKNIVCTTTLMQGVNLPAKNIIARNQSLTTQSRTGAKLTPYEFANLRGRAGRLMKDFVGRAIVLDENSYEASQEGDAVQTTLFEYPEKKLSSGYGERFIESKEEIKQALLAGSKPADENSFNDLTTHIRHMVLRYGDKVFYMLEKTGITISSPEFDIVNTQLRDLAIPAHILIKNPHWDPLVLNDLFLKISSSNFKLPSSPFAHDFVDSLTEVLELVKATTPYYYNKYTKIRSDKVLRKCLIIAQDWGKEIPIRTILSWKGEPSDEDIDHTLDLLNTEITYRLPKLLHPTFSMLEQENPLLSFMEHGAYKPETRRLIEFGISRELAIKISSLLKIEGAPTQNSELSDWFVKSELVRIYETNALNHWENIQIEPHIEGVFYP